MDTERPPGALMAAEIAEQPAALQRLLDDGLPTLRAVAAKVAKQRPRFVLLAARGTSDHAALYAKYLIEIGLGLPAGLASPSTLTTYGSRPAYDDVLWVTDHDPTTEEICSGEAGPRNSIDTSAVPSHASISDTRRDHAPSKSPSARWERPSTSDTATTWSRHTDPGNRKPPDAGP